MVGEDSGGVACCKQIRMLCIRPGRWLNSCISPIHTYAVWRQKKRRSKDVEQLKKNKIRNRLNINYVFLFVLSYKDSNLD